MGWFRSSFRSSRGGSLVEYLILCLLLSLFAFESLSTLPLSITDPLDRVNALLISGIYEGGGGAGPPSSTEKGGGSLEGGTSNGCESDGTGCPPPSPPPPPCDDPDTCDP